MNLFVLHRKIPNSRDFFFFFSLLSDTDFQAIGVRNNASVKIVSWKVDVKELSCHAILLFHTCIK